MQASEFPQAAVRERLTDLPETTIGFAVLQDGKIVHASHALCELADATLEGLRDRAFHELMTHEHHHRLRSNLARLDRPGAEFIMSCELDLRGSSQPVEVIAEFAEWGGAPASIVLVRDLTDRERAQVRLRDSEDRYRTLYENNPSMYFTVDRNGVVLSVNRFGAEQLGYQPRELIGANVLQVFHKDDRASVKTQLMDCLSELGQVVTWEFRKIRKDGSMLWVHERARTIRNRDGYPIVLIVCEDLTNRKAAEIEHARFQERLQQAQKLEGLGLMAGGVAHDFNNLLVGVLTNAMLALDTLPPDAPAYELVQSIEKAADRASDLCKQLLAYTGRGRRHVRPVDLSELVRGVSDLLEVAVRRKGSIHYSLENELPSVDADATQLEQVVMNLVTNASDALGASEGGVTVRTEVLSFEHDTENPPYERIPKGTYSCLEVADSGAGMSADVVARMFDPFFTTKFTGRGLGLATVLGIVRGHGGAIQVRSTPGEGTAVRALFPATSRPSESLTKTRPRTASWSGSGTVLVVDDEPVVRSSASRVLTDAGFRVLLASDGLDAIEVFERNSEGIALVLLDMTMPRCSGEETFRRIRKIRPDVRVLLSTGYDDEDITKKFGNDGPDECIQKPYRPEQLLRSVRAAVER